MRFMIRALQQEYNDDPWSGWAWVVLDDAAIKELLEKRELLQMVKSKSDQIYEMWFWSHPAYFFEDGDINYEDFLTRVEIEEFESEGFLRVPDTRELPMDGEGVGFGREPEGADCEQLVISERGVSFYSCLERIDGNVRSDEVSYELLLKK
ncbi:MAG: hypothetical protein OK454_02105 [Thaumarchaeota archaeon]|nr:hypothetical protein [Nitrososphaerota archaeon]